MNKFFKTIVSMALFLFVGFSAHAFINREVAVVRIMDKAAGKTQTINIPVDTEIQFGKLNIRVRSCLVSDPFQAQDSYMFVEVNNDAKIFSGWMSQTNPGANPLQNPDYDLWLVSCE